jgi:hypothetical protein
VKLSDRFCIACFTCSFISNYYTIPLEEYVQNNIAIIVFIFYFFRELVGRGKPADLSRRLLKTDLPGGRS